MPGAEAQKKGNSEPERPQVVIVGGGFDGLSAARSFRGVPRRWRRRTYILLHAGRTDWFVFTEGTQAGVGLLRWDCPVQELHSKRLLPAHCFTFCLNLLTCRCEKPQCLVLSIGVEPG
jgi:hypothetical protein